MTKRNKICLAALLLTAFLSAFGAFRLLIYGSQNPPVGIGIEDVALTAEQFCRAVNQADYDSMEALINGYSSLEFEVDSSLEVDAALQRCLADSYSCRQLEAVSTNGMRASQDIEISYFCFSLAEDDIRQYTSDAYDRLLIDGGNNDNLYDENGNLLESLAMDMYHSAVDSIISNRDRYMVTKAMTLEFVYENGRWEVILSDELADALLGKSGS